MIIVDQKNNEPEKIKSECIDIYVVTSMHQIVCLLISSLIKIIHCYTPNIYMIKHNIR